MDAHIRQTSSIWAQLGMLALSVGLTTGCLVNDNPAPLEGEQDETGSGGSGGDVASGGSAGDAAGGTGTGGQGPTGGMGTGGDPGPVIDDTDLMALYEFDDAPGSTTVADTSGVAPALDLEIQNTDNAIWTDSALDVIQPTIVRTPGPATKIINRCKQTNELTIETWVTPADLDQGGPARMITLSADTATRNFTLGQTDDRRYDVRLRSEQSDLQGSPSLSTPLGEDDVKTILAYVVYVRDANGDRSIYVNGELRAEDNLGGSFANWNDDYAFALANELTNNRPFLGEFHKVAVYCRALAASEITTRYNLGD